MKSRVLALVLVLLICLLGCGGDPKPPSGFVHIHPGMYLRGSLDNEEGRESDEGPRHQVILTQGFFVSKTAVTQAKWTRVMGSNPSYFKGDDLPVEHVSWHDALTFCNKLSEQQRLEPAYLLLDGIWNWDRTANGYRLPTEAEWEYACRAGTTTRYHTGNSEADLDRAGWYAHNSDGKTHPVGLKEANAWGLYDMHGNVWEWCWDQYGLYPPGQVTDPYDFNPTTGAGQVIRGGSFHSWAGSCRSSRRFDLNSTYESYDVGLRLVRSVF